MKKLSFLFISTLLCITLNATTKTVNVINAGTLHNSFSPAEYSSVTDLTITGNIDARDFKFMRDTLTVIQKIDMSTVNIMAYSGNGGTVGGYYSYPKDAIPDYGLYIAQSIISVLLPNSLIEIGYCAFQSCINLEYIIVPDGVTKLGGSVFMACEKLEHIQFNSPVAPSLIPNVPDASIMLGVTHSPNTNIYYPVNSTGYDLPTDFGGWGLIGNPSYTLLQGKISDYSLYNLPTLSANQEKTTLSINTYGLSAEISGLKEGERLTIYTLSGFSIYSKTTTKETVNLIFPCKGLFILKTESFVVKISL
jgi:hypothetical protein